MQCADSVFYSFGSSEGPYLPGGCGCDFQICEHEGQSVQFLKFARSAALGRHLLVGGFFRDEEGESSCGVARLVEEMCHTDLPPGPEAIFNEGIVTGILRIVFLLTLCMHWLRFDSQFVLDCCQVRNWASFLSQKYQIENMQTNTAPQ